MGNRIYLSIGAILALSGCFGSSADVDVLSSTPFGASAGVARAVTGDDHFIAIIPDIESPEDYAHLSIVRSVSASTDANGLSSGTIEVEYANGEREEVTAYFYDDIAGIYGTFGSDNPAIIIGGAAPEGLPLGASYNYDGLAVVEFLIDGADYNETGTFSMTADFIDRTASLNVTSDNASFDHSNMQIETTGLYDATGGTLTITAGSGDTRTLDLYGSFHGENAEYVTGAGVSGTRSGDDFSYIAIIGDRN
ncbi:MAG: hypothetical protein JJ872_11505 [Marivivens sp.]|nr:hypothetical protein [Marivivens sp.]